MFCGTLACRCIYLALRRLDVAFTVGCDVTSSCLTTGRLHLVKVEIGFLIGERFPSGSVPLLAIL